MALESFYGGKQGISPVIKAKFKYINTEDLAYKGRDGSTTNLTKEEAIWLNDASNETSSYEEGNKITWDSSTLKPFTMDECLKDPNYTDVWYGELCIIDTDNKMNPNNGKIYRRTLKQVNNKLANTADTLYAEYVGQIVGPSGGAPKISVGSLNNERDKALGKQPTYETDVNLDNSNWDYSYPTKDNSEKIITTTAHPGKDRNKIAVLTANESSANIQMVPGKVDDNNYNDHIRYTWCNVQRKLDDKNSDIWVYLGFEIPYTTYDVKGKEENYTYNEPVFIDNSSKPDNEEYHPFYKNYEFHIPRGARGIGPEEIFCINPKDENTRNLPEGTILYRYDAINYNQQEDKYIIDTTKEKSVSSTDSYWVGKWSIYNSKIKFTNEINTDVIYIYLGSYKDVRAIQLDPNGTLTFTYSDNSTYTPTKKLTWIKSAEVLLDDTDDNQGDYGQFKLKIDFNNNDETSNILIDKNLHLIKNVTYDDTTGQIKFNYSGNIIKETGSIKYIKTLNVNTTQNDNNYGKVTGIINTGETSEIGTLPLIKNSSYDESMGIITFNYSGNNNTIISSTAGPLEYISKMKVLEDGTLQYQLNTESGDTWTTVTDGSKQNPKPLRIKDVDNLIIKTSTNSVTVAENETAINGHLYVLYRGETEYEDLGQVKTSPTIGSVLHIKNGTDEFFTDADKAITLLNDNGYSIGEDTSIGTDGSIIIKGEDKTGGFISFAVGSKEDKTVYLAYFDPIKGDNGKWVNAGLFGGQSSINIKSYNPNSNSELLPWDGTAEITFGKDPDASPGNSKCPITNFPWLEF